MIKLKNAMDLQELIKNKSLFEAIKSEKIKDGASKSMGYVSSKLKSESNKAQNISDNSKSISIEVVANTPLYLDSDSDVVLQDAFDINNLEFPELDTHNKGSIRSIITYGTFEYKDVKSVELGLEGNDLVKTLVFKANINKKSSPVEFEKYSDNLIRQHSLGFRYDDLAFACNETGEEWIEEKALWDEIYPMLLNKDKADNLGYFWVVKKGTIREVSACVFGACPITPTINVEESEKTTKTFFNYKN